MEERLFFALVPPMPVRVELGVLSQMVGRVSHGRPVALRNLHLTLLFLGGTPSSRLEEIRAGASEVVQVASTCCLQLDKIAFWEDIAWLGSSAFVPELDRLVDALKWQMQKVKVGYHEMPFVPHITLARKASAEVELPDFHALQWQVGQMALMTSREGEAGLEYDIIEAWDLPSSKQSEANMFVTDVSVSR